MAKELMDILHYPEKLDFGSARHRPRHPRLVDVFKHETVQYMRGEVTLPPVLDTVRLIALARPAASERERIPWSNIVRVL